MRHQGLQKGQAVKIYSTRKELNEAYAREVEGQTVVGGHIVQTEVYADGQQFVTPLKVPDYVAELGFRQVMTAVSQKLFGETESVMCTSYE